MDSISKIKLKQAAGMMLTPSEIRIIEGFNPNMIEKSIADKARQLALTNIIIEVGDGSQDWHGYYFITDTNQKLIWNFKALWKMSNPDYQQLIDDEIVQFLTCKQFRLKFPETMRDGDDGDSYLAKWTHFVDSRQFFKEMSQHS